MSTTPLMATTAAAAAKGRKKASKASSPPETTPSSSLPTTRRSLRERQDDKRRNVFRLALDSPLKPQWPKMTEVEQVRLLNAVLGAVQLSKAKHDGCTMTLGLQHAVKLLHTAVASAAANKKPEPVEYVVVVLRGATHPAHLQSWMPAAVQLARSAGFPVSVLALAIDAAEEKLRAAMSAKRVACLTIKINKPIREGQLDSLVSLAKAAAQPEVPWLRSVHTLYEQTRKSDEAQREVTALALLRRWRPVYLPTQMHVTQGSAGAVVDKGAARLSRKQRRAARRAKRAAARSQAADALSKPAKDEQKMDVD
ncbi:hypothetical protein RI367_002790 [Sorochytrium milnesiophthora]